MARKTSASVQAYRRLKALIQKSLDAGDMAIPSERVLAETFSVSRMTLRKALARVLDEKLLYQVGTSYLVAKPPQSAVAPQSPRATLVFAARGIGTPSNRVWARLASHLARRCQAAQVRLKLLLLRPELVASQQRLKLSQIPDCDAMVVAPDAAGAIPLKLWLERKRVPLIATETLRLEAASTPAWDTVGCDHFYVGKQGARCLAEQGCERPLFLGWELKAPYEPFLQRERGFIAEFGRRGQVMKIGPNAPGTQTPTADRERRFAQLIPQIISGEYDGLFVQSDEHLRFLVNTLSAYGELPPVVSVLGNGDLNEHALPVAYFDHAERQAACRIMQRLEQILAGEATRAITQWIQPEFHTPPALRAAEGAAAARQAARDAFQLVEV